MNGFKAYFAPLRIPFFAILHPSMLLKMNPFWENAVQLGMPIGFLIAAIVTVVYFWDK